MKNYKINPVSIEINKRKENTIFPHPLRCLMIGSSGSGKTTVLFNIITKYWIPYQNLYIFTKSIEQPIYKKLQEVFKNIEIGSNFSDLDIIPLDECKPNSLVVFDDYILENQSKIKEYFVRGRHKNISCIYLSQSYSMVDLKVIRTNCNFIVVFELSNHYIEKIWKDFRICMSLNEFILFCENAWKNKFGFISLDITNKRLYKHFDHEL